MNSAQIKIQKTSKIVSNCLLFFQIITFLVIVIEIIGIFSLAFAQEGTIWRDIGTEPLFSPFIGIISDVSISDGAVTAILAAGILNSSIMIAMLFLARAIFKDISREYTPFSDRHINRLKIISLLLLTFTMFPPLIEMLLTMVLAPNIEATVSFDLSNIIFVVVFYCLAQIFDYGRILQQQSDETL
jgi:hypothetical protein